MLGLYRGEIVRFVIALIVLVGGGVLVAAVWFVPSQRDPAGVITAVIAIMSGVIGHYFGSQGVERAQRVAETEGELERQAAVQVSAYRSAAMEYARIAEAAERDPHLRESLKRALEEGGDEP